ncbi:MAG: hypothetical protein WCW27_03275, partial [Patescibacteria group bacterium]
MHNLLKKTAYLSWFVLFFGILLTKPVTAADTTTNLVEQQTTATATNLGLYGSHTWDIAVDPTNNQYVYIATYYSPNGFFRSSDGGTTWTGLPNTVDHGSGRAVEVNPNNGYVYALLNDLLVSTDHGATYTVAAELGAGAGTMLYAHNTLFVTTNDEIMLSTDEGTNFSTNTVCANETIWSLASASDAIYALCYNYNAGFSTLYKSTDFGTNWTDANIAASNIMTAEKVFVNPVTNQIFLVPSSTGGTTYRSTDGAVSWTALASTTPLTGNMNFNSTGRIYVGWYYSDNNGDSWTQFDDSGNYSHIVMPDPTNDNILYDTTAPGFWQSTDSGANWTASVTGITAVEVTSIAQLSSNK